MYHAKRLSRLSEWYSTIAQYFTLICTIIVHTIALRKNYVRYFSALKDMYNAAQ